MLKRLGCRSVWYCLLDLYFLLILLILQSKSFLKVKWIYVPTSNHVLRDLKKNCTHTHTYFFSFLKAELNRRSQHIIMIKISFKIKQTRGVDLLKEQLVKNGVQFFHPIVQVFLFSLHIMGSKSTFILLIELFLLL